MSPYVACLTLLITETFSLAIHIIDLEKARNDSFKLLNSMTLVYYYWCLFQINILNEIINLNPNTVK